MSRSGRITVSIRQPRLGLDSVKLKLMVVSGKGGVGKSFVTSSVATGMALRGLRVGILDGDVYGPTIPKMLGLSGTALQADEGTGKIYPVVGPLGIKVVSIEFALPSDETAVIWRAPLVNRALEEFLGSVEWGELDALVIDLPPGTGDAPLTIAQKLQNDLDGSIIVTIPSEISRRIVLKSIDFSAKLNVPVAGIVENMCCFYCPESGKTYYVFGRGAGERIAAEKGIRFLGSIPLDPRIGESNDRGEPYLLRHGDSETAKRIMAIVDGLIELYKDKLAGEKKGSTRRLLRLPGEGSEGEA